MIQTSVGCQGEEHCGRLCGYKRHHEYESAGPNSSWSSAEATGSFGPDWDTCRIIGTAEDSKSSRLDSSFLTVSWRSVEGESVEVWISAASSPLFKNISVWLHFLCHREKKNTWFKRRFFPPSVEEKQCEVWNISFYFIFFLSSLWIETLKINKP